MCDTIKAEIDRSIAQPGSAPGLGPGGRRFESYCSDQLKHVEKHCFRIGQVSHDSFIIGYAPVAQLDRASAF